MVSRRKRPQRLSTKEEEVELVVTRPVLFGELGTPKRERVSDRELVLKFLGGELRSRRNQDLAKEMLRHVLLECSTELKPLPLNIGVALATLFNPGYVRLTIKHHQGAKGARGYSIALRIAHEHVVQGSKFEQAVQDAADAYGVSWRTAARAWNKHWKAAEKEAKELGNLNWRRPD
jgi:hypothetical protein